MRKSNHSANTVSQSKHPHLRWFAWSILAMLLLSPTKAGAGKAVIARQKSAFETSRAQTYMATGVPYDVVVTSSFVFVTGVGFGPGKISLPVLEFGRVLEKVKLIDVKVDDPSVVEIIGQKGAVITLRGKVPGATTLRVKTRGTLGMTETEHTTVGSATPSSVRLEPECHNPKGNGQTPLLVGAGGELGYSEQLYFDGILLVSNNFPDVETGPLTPVAPSADKGRSPTPGDLLDTKYLRVKAPAEAITTSLKVPAFKSELPVRVYTAAAVSSLRIEAPNWLEAQTRAVYLPVEYLVGDQVPCIKPALPVVVTIGPSSVCDLERIENAMKKTNDDYRIAEMPFVNAVGMRTFGEGTCNVTLEAKAIGKSARVQIAVKKIEGYRPRSRN